MADQELDRLLIKVDSELGDLSGIDKAINALGRMRDFGSDASKGVKQLEAMGKALKQFDGLNLDGINRASDGIHAMVDVLERLGGSSTYIRHAQRGMRDLRSSLDISKESRELQKDLDQVNKAIEEVKGKSSKTESFSFIDTEALKKDADRLRSYADKNEGATDKHYKTLIDSYESFATKMEAIQKRLVENSKEFNLGGGKDDAIKTRIEKDKAEIQSLGDSWKEVAAEVSKLTGEMFSVPKKSVSLGSVVGDIKEQNDALTSLTNARERISQRLAELSKEEQDALKAEAAPKDSIYERLEGLSNMGDIMQQASAGIKALNDLGEALNKFDSIGQRLDGMDKVTVGIGKMIGVLIRLSEFTGSASNGVAELWNLGESLHAFDGIGENLKGIDQIVIALDRLAKVFPKFKDVNKDDFNFIGYVADQFNQFNMAGSYVPIGIMAGSMAKLINVLASAQGINYKVIGQIADQFREFNKVEDMNVITDNIKRLTEVLKLLDSTSQKAKLAAEAIGYAYNDLFNGLEAINGKMPEVSKRFDAAADTLRDSGLYEELKRFKTLNDSYQSMNNFVSGLAHLYDVLSSGKDIKPHGLQSLKASLDETFGGEISADIKANINNYQEITDAIARLFNAMKFAHIDKYDNELMTLKTQLDDMVSTSKNLQGFSYTLYGLRDLINALTVAADGTKLNIDTAPLKALIDACSTADGQTIANTGTGIKKLAPALKTLETIKPEVLERIAPAIQKITSSIGNIGNNNTLNIKIPKDGVAQIKSVSKQISAAWDEIEKKTNEKVASIDFAKSFQFGDTRHELEKQLVELERSLKKRERLIREAQDKMDKAMVFSKTEKARDMEALNEEIKPRISQEAFESIKQLYGEFEKLTDAKKQVSDALGNLDTDLTFGKKTAEEVAAEQPKLEAAEQNIVSSLEKTKNQIEELFKSLNISDVLGQKIEDIEKLTLGGSDRLDAELTSLEKRKKDLEDSLASAKKDLEESKGKWDEVKDFKPKTKEEKNGYYGVKNTYEADEKVVANLEAELKNVTNLIEEQKAKIAQFDTNVTGSMVSEIEAEVASLKEAKEAVEAALADNVLKTMKHQSEFGQPNEQLNAEREKLLAQQTEINQKLDEQVAKLEEARVAASALTQSFQNNKNYQKAYYDFQVETEYAKQLKNVIAEIEDRLKNMPRISIKSDVEGLTQLDKLEAEYKKYNDVLERLRGSEGDMRADSVGDIITIEDHLQNVMADMAGIREQMENFEESAEAAAYKCSKIADEMNRAAEESKKATEELKKVTGEGFSSFGSLLKSSNSDILKSAGDIFSTLGSKVGKMEGVSQGMAAAAGALGKFAGAAGQVMLVFNIMKAIRTEMHKLTTTIFNAVKSMVEFSKQMLSKVVGAFNAVAGAVKKCVSLVQSGAEIMTSAVKKLGSAVGEVAKQFLKLGSVARSVGSIVAKTVLKSIPGVGMILKNGGKSLSSIVKKTAVLGGLVKKFGSIIKKLDNLIIKRAILAFVNEIKQAFDDMAVYSYKMGTKFNENVSKVFSALRRLANQWMAAFEPLINYLTPLVLTLLEALRTVGENVAKFMALLTGQNYYLRAKPFYEDYAKQVDKANKSVKNLTNSLDELNILNDSKSSDEDEGVKPEDMWEKVPVEGSLQFPNINLQDILDKIKDFLRNIPWDKIKEWLRDKVKKLVDILNQIIADKELWALIGKTIGELINTLFEMIDEFVWGLDWYGLGQDIALLIKNALETLDWDLIRHAVEGMARALALLLNGIFDDKELWEDVGDFIAHCINDGIVNALKSFAWYFDMGNMVDSLLIAINTALERIDWNQIYEMFDLWAEDIADAINVLFGNERFWKNLGDTIANAINSIFYFLDDLANRIDFSQIGKALALGIEEALNSFDWNTISSAFDRWAKGLADIINGILSNESLFKDLGTTLANALNTLIGALRDFVNRLEAEQLGQRLGEALQAFINAFDVLKAFQLPVDAINQLAAVINGLWDKLDLGIAGQKIAEALMRALENIKWDEIKRAVERSVANIVSFMNEVFANEQLWKDLGKTIGETVDTIIKVPINILWQLDWSKAGIDLGNLMNELVRNIDLEGIGTKLGETVSKMLNGFVNFLNTFDFKDFGRRIGAALTNFFNGFSREDVFGAIYAAFDKLGDWISGIIQEMNKNGTFYNIGSKIAAALSAAIAGLSNFLDDNAGAIKEALDDLFRGFLYYIDEHQADIEKWLNNIIDKVCDIIQNFFDNRTDLIKKISEILGNLHLGEILGTILGNIIRSFFDNITIDAGVLQGIIGDLGNFFEKIGEALAPYAFEFLMTMVGKIIGGIIGKKIGTAIGAKIGGVLGSAFGPIGTVVGSIIGGVLGAIAAALLSNFDGLKDVLTGILDFITGIFKAIGDVISGIIDWIGKGLSAIGDFFSNLFGGGDKKEDKKEEKKDEKSSTTDEKIVVDTENVQALKEVITAAIKDAEPILVKIEPESITALADAIKNALGGGTAAGGGMTMNSQGTDIGGYPEGQWTAKGLEDGLYNNSDKIDNWGVERAEAIIKGYSDRMEIASPSKVMEQLGSWTGEGLYNGLAAWIKKLVALINEIADAIVNALKGIVDVVTGAMNLISGALSGFGSILSGAGQGLANLGQKIGDFLSGKKESNVGDTVKKDIDDAVTYANNKLGDIKYDSISQNIAEQIKKGFEGITIPVDIDKSALKASLDEITKIINDWLDVNRSIFEPLRENFKKALLGMESDARSILGEIKNLFTNYINSIAEALGNIGKNFNLDNIKNAIEDAGKNLGEATEKVVKDAEKNYGGTGDVIGGGTVTKGEDNGGSSLPSELEKYLELDLLEEHAADALERLCKLAIEHVGHVKDAIWELIHEIPNELRRTFESANLASSGVQDLFDDNPDDLLLQLYAHWRFADAIVAAYNDALKKIEEDTRLKCDVILGVWRQYIDKICALFEKIEKAWEAAFKKIKAVIKKRMREIYNLFRQWMKKIYDLVHSMPNYWKAAMKLDGVTNEELSKVYADFEELTEKLRKLFDKIARMWRDMMRKFPEYANRYLAATRQKFIDFVNKVKHILSGLSFNFDEEMAKFPEIADKYLDQVCKKFEEHIQHMKDLLATIAPYFAETMQKLAEVADEALEKVCDVFELHMNHIKDMIRSILEVWEYVMSKFPEIAQKYLEKTCELFTRFKECVIEKLDQILQKWISVMKQFPHLAELYLNQTDGKFANFTNGVKNKFDDMGNKWTYVMNGMEDLARTRFGNISAMVDALNNQFNAMTEILNGMDEVVHDLEAAWASILDKVNEYVETCKENGIDPYQHAPIDTSDLDALVQQADELCDILSGENYKRGSVKAIYHDLVENVEPHLQKITNNTYAIYHLLKRWMNAMRGYYGGGDEEENKPVPGSSTASSASSSNAIGATKPEIVDAIKDAAEDLAKTFKDELFPDGLEAFGCNCNCGEGSGSSNGGDGGHGGDSGQSGDNTLDKDDIADAIRDAADDVADAIADKVNPSGGSGKNPVSKKDIEDAIKDAADAVSDALGGSPSKKKITDAIKDAAGDIAKKIKDALDPDGDQNNKKKDPVSKDDIEDAIKDAADDIADAIKDAVSPNGGDGDGITDDELEDELEKHCGHIQGWLEKILDAINDILDYLKDRDEDDDDDDSEGCSCGDVDLDYTNNLLQQILDKIPTGGSSSSSNNNDENKGSNNNGADLSTVEDLLRQILNKIPPSAAASSSASSNENGADLGKILDMLRQIRDRIPEDLASLIRGNNNNNNNNGNGGGGAGGAGGAGGNGTKGDSSYVNVDLSQVLELLRQIRDKIPTELKVAAETTKDNSFNYNIDLSDIIKLLTEIRDRIPKISDKSGKSTGDGFTVNIDYEEINKAASRLEAAAESIEKRLKDSAEALQKAGKDVKDAIASIVSAVSALSTAATNISSALWKVKKAIDNLCDWIERLHGAIANNTSALKNLKLGDSNSNTNQSSASAASGTSAHGNGSADADASATATVGDLSESFEKLITAVTELTEQIKGGFNVTATCNCNCSCCDKNCAGNGSGSASGGSGSSGGSSGSTSDNGSSSSSSGGSGSSSSSSSGSSSSGSSSSSSSGSSSSSEKKEDSSTVIDNLVNSLLNGAIGNRAVAATLQNGNESLPIRTGTRNIVSGEIKTATDTQKNLASQNKFTGDTISIDMLPDEMKAIGSASGWKALTEKLGKGNFKLNTNSLSGYRSLEFSRSSPIGQAILDAYKNRVTTKGYAMGGMPNSGELFIARENGTPEMVGSIGGHTAVANANEQIVSAVAGGVAQSNEQVVAAINNASSSVVTAIDNKDTTVRIGDREIAAANNRGQKQIGRNLMS